MIVGKLQPRWLIHKILIALRHRNQVQLRLPRRGKVHGGLQVVREHELLILLDSLLILALNLLEILQFNMIELANRVSILHQDALDRQLLLLQLHVGTLLPGETVMPDIHLLLFPLPYVAH